MQRFALAPRRKGAVSVNLGGGGALCGVCNVSVCLFGFPPGTLAPSGVVKTRMSV